MDIKDLSRCLLFSGLSPDELEQLLSSVQTQERFFERGDIIAMQDEVCNRLIILTKGSVTAEMNAPSGKVIKVEDIFAPQTPAVLFLFGNKNKFPVQIMARENTETLIVYKDSILKMLSLNQKLLKNYLDISANYASVLAEKLYIMSFRTIRQKLAMYILKLAADKSVAKLDKSQDALAEYFGVSRPSLSRELKNMQDDGLISANRRQIQVLDREKLLRLIRFE